MNLFSILPLLLAFASASASESELELESANSSPLLRGSTLQGVQDDMSSNHHRDLEKCKDNKKKYEKFQRVLDGEKNTCKYYAENNECEKEILCGDDKGKSVREVCGMSCDMCRTEPECEDDKKQLEKFKLKEDGKMRSCKFYANTNKCDEEIRCGDDNGKMVWEVCGMSCDMCNEIKLPECTDDKKQLEKFKLKKVGKMRSCKFYANSNKCDEEIRYGDDNGKMVWEVCGMSCDMCNEIKLPECTDDKKQLEKFKLKEDGKMRSCKFFANTNKCDEEILCGDDNGKMVWEVCGMSCNRCDAISV